MPFITSSLFPAKFPALYSQTLPFCSGALGDDLQCALEQSSILQLGLISFRSFRRFFWGLFGLFLRLKDLPNINSFRKGLDSY